MINMLHGPKKRYNAGTINEAVLDMVDVTFVTLLNYVRNHYVAPSLAGRSQLPMILAEF